MNKQDGDLAYVEWSETTGKLMAVGVWDYGTRRIRTIDIDWCERDQSYYCHFSGSGPMEGFGEIGRGIGRLPRGIVTFDQLIEHFELYEETETVFCSVCQDHLPDTDVCEHLVWNDEAGDWVVRADGAIQPR